MEKQERKSNVTTKIKKSTLARGKWQLSPTLRQYPAELSQTWAIVRKAEGRVITSSSGLRGVPTVIEQELRAHWWQQDVTFKTGVGILAVEYSRYMYPVYGTHRHMARPPCRDAKKAVSGWEKCRALLWHSFGAHTRTFQQVEPQQ